MRALSIAATGMLAQQTNVEVIANNLANMNTTAFKAQRAEFQDLLYENIERPGAATADTGSVLPSGIQIGVGVRTAATYRLTSQGNLATDRKSLRPCDQRQGLFPRHDAGQHGRVHARRCVLAVARRPDRHREGLCRGSRHRHSAGRALGHDQRGRPGAGACRRLGRAADPGPARARALPQRLRLAGHRRQSLHRDRPHRAPC